MSDKKLYISDPSLRVIWWYLWFFIYKLNNGKCTWNIDLSTSDNTMFLERCFKEKKHRSSAVFFRKQPYLKNVIRGKIMSLVCWHLHVTVYEIRMCVRRGCGWSDRQDLEHEWKYYREVINMYAYNKNMNKLIEQCSLMTF